MAKLYYQASTNSFFNDDLHGPREITIRDPDWVAPKSDAQQKEFQHPPTITVPNPDCKLPDDAVEITAERHAELMAAQGSGKVIAAGDDGLPVANDPPPLTPEQVLANTRMRRDQLLKASDWTQMQDNPLPPATKAAWANYRQALRDMPSKPADAAWPVAPGGAP